MKNQKKYATMDKIQQKTTKSVETGLSSIQEQTAILLASGESITAVAEKMNVNRSTIYQWQTMLTFQCFFNQQKKDIREELKSGIFMLGDMAMNTLKDCLHSENEQVRLKASLAILEKIENATIGDCDARAILKEKATYDDELNWGSAYLHEEEYQKLLNENGLK